MCLAARTQRNMCFRCLQAERSPSIASLLSFLISIILSAPRIAFVCEWVRELPVRRPRWMQKKTQQKAKKKSRHGAFFAMRSKKASFPPDASESLSCSPAKCADENAKEENEKLQNSNQLISGSFYLSLSLHPLRLRAHTFRPKGTVWEIFCI